jgi:hypothetical protein
VERRQPLLQGAQLAAVVHLAAARTAKAVHSAPRLVAPILGAGILPVANRGKHN